MVFLMFSVSFLCAQLVILEAEQKAEGAEEAETSSRNWGKKKNKRYTASQYMKLQHQQSKDLEKCWYID